MSKKRDYVLLILVVLGFTLFSIYYTNTFRVTSEKFQDLYFAITISLAGIAIHFLKNYPKLARSIKIAFESLELLMLVMTPTLVSYKVIKDAYPNSAYALIIPTMLALSSWYTVSLIRISKIENKSDGKFAYYITMLFFWSITILLVFLTAVVMYFT